MTSTPAWITRSRKAIAAFLIPVVPAVGDIVASGKVTRAAVWLVVIAVLSGAGVYKTRNK